MRLKYTSFKSLTLKSIANAFLFSDQPTNVLFLEWEKNDEGALDRASMSEAARFVYSGKRMENVNKKKKKHLFRRLNSLPK